MYDYTKIKEAREEFGLTVVEMAELMGLSKAGYHNIEIGRNKPNSILWWNMQNRIKERKMEIEFNKKMRGF